LLQSASTITRMKSKSASTHVTSNKGNMTFFLN